MRPDMCVLLAAGLGLTLIVTPVLAHHSFMVVFDMSKPIVVKGTVTSVTWTNPHISFHVDVADARGNVTNWGVDAAAPSALSRRGWHRTSLNVGDAVTVEGYPARDGTSFVTATMVTLADGRKIFAGSDGAYPR